MTPEQLTLDLSAARTARDDGIASVEANSGLHRIPLPSGHIAVVDHADRNLVAGYMWRAALVRPRTVYVKGRLRADRRTDVYLHRLIMDPPPDRQVDHQNGNGLDNRRVNLRIATAPQNRANQQAPRTNTSGYKGVSWDKRKRRWAAYIHVDDRHRFLGYFDDPSAAARAYNQAAIEAWGEFARLNVLRQSARPAGHARAVAVWRGVKG